MKVTWIDKEEKEAERNDLEEEERKKETESLDGVA